MTQKVNIKTTPKEMRQFGLILSAGLMGLFGGLFPLIFGREIAAWPWIVGSLILIPTLIMPRALKILYLPWMKFGAVMGWINTRIILGVIYFVLITPIGLVMRLCGHDPMRRRYDPNLKSYRRISEQRSIQHMERPF